MQDPHQFEHSLFGHQEVRMRSFDCFFQDPEELNAVSFKIRAMNVSLNPL